MPMTSRMKFGLPLAVALLFTAQAVAAPPTPLLWKIEKGEATVWLLGSIHAMRGDDYPLAPEVEAAFADAERLVFELAPDEATSPALAGQMLGIAAFDDGRDLLQVLGPGDYAKVERALAAQGVPAAAMRGFEPWFVGLTLALGAASRAGFDSGNGLDLTLMRRARVAGKPSSGLETAAEQLGALDATPMAEQVLGLRRSLETPEAIVDDVRRLHRLWRAGDVSGLERATIEELAGQPQTYRLIVSDRNRRWLPQIERFAHDANGDDTLVVVGALHLIGADGEIALLESKGYRVERVCASCKEPL